MFHQLSHTECRRCSAPPFQSLILQFFNFLAVEMNKKEPVKINGKETVTNTEGNQRGGSKKKQQQQKKPITHVGKPTVGKCCTRATCSESDNPPMSSLCVNQNFYLLLWGERHSHREQQPAAKESRKPQTEMRIKSQAATVGTDT